MKIINEHLQHFEKEVILQTPLQALLFLKKQIIPSDIYKRLLNLEKEAEFHTAQEVLDAHLFLSRNPLASDVAIFKAIRKINETKQQNKTLPASTLSEESEALNETPLGLDNLRFNFKSLLVGLSKGEATPEKKDKIQLSPDQMISELISTYGIKKDEAAARAYFLEKVRPEKLYEIYDIINSLSRVYVQSISEVFQGGGKHAMVRLNTGRIIRSKIIHGDTNGSQGDFSRFKLYGIQEMERKWGSNLFGFQTERTILPWGTGKLAALATDNFFSVALIGSFMLETGGRTSSTFFHFSVPLENKELSEKFITFMSSPENKSKEKEALLSFAIGRLSQTPTVLPDQTNPYRGRNIINSNREQVTVGNSFPQIKKLTILSEKN